MTSVAGLDTSTAPTILTIQANLERATGDLLASLPDPRTLSTEERRGIIATTQHYSRNFIYWMTGAYLSVGSDEARARSSTTCARMRGCHQG